MLKKLLNSPVFLLASIAVIALAAALSPKTKLLVEAAADSTLPGSMALSEQWTVVSVADGDTITVKRDGETKKIRFCGMDAPEKSQPLGQDSRRNLQTLVSEAKNQVMISAIEKDRYGRTVGEVFTSVQGREKFLNEEQLTSGLGYYYAQYANKCPNRDVLEKAEAIAKSAHKGVWSGNYQRPWDYRREQRSGLNRN